MRRMTFLRQEQGHDRPSGTPRTASSRTPLYLRGKRSLTLWDLILYGAIVLLLTGLVLWFTDYLPWSLRWLRYLAVLLHPIAALVTIGNFFIHVYMGVFAERGAFGSVIRGDVSLAFAKRYHPGWYQEIVGSSNDRK